MTLDSRLARRHEYCDGKVATRDVLLVPQILIGGHKDLVTSRFSFSEQLTVLYPAPAELKDGGDNMVSQQRSKWHGRALIEQDAHLRDFQ